MTCDPLLQTSWDIRTASARASFSLCDQLPMYSFQEEPPTLSCLRRNVKFSPSPPPSVSRSVVSDMLRPHGLQPARLLCPWSSPGKHAGVGCHFFTPKAPPGPGVSSPSASASSCPDPCHAPCRPPGLREPFPRNTPRGGLSPAVRPQLFSRAHSSTQAPGPKPEGSSILQDHGSHTKAEKRKHQLGKHTCPSARCSCL